MRALLLLCLLLQSPRLASSVYKRVFAWGLNRYGTTGFGKMAANESVGNCEPRLVLDVGWPVLQPLQLEIDSVVAGYDASLAFTTNGSVFVWGRNDKGQLGLGINASTENNKPKLLPLAALPAGGARTGCCGQYHCLLLTPTGNVYASGDGELGQLGLGVNLTRTPATFLPLPRSLFGGVSVTNVTCGAAHSIALTLDGSVYGWGANEEGQLGLCDALPGDAGFDPACLQPMFSPQQVPGLPPIKLIATGGGFMGGQLGDVPSGSHTLAAVRDDPGALYAWGSNFYGQLGLQAVYSRLGNYSLRSTPNTVMVAAPGNGSGYVPSAPYLLGALPAATAALQGSFTTLDAYTSAVLSDLTPLPTGLRGERVSNFVPLPTLLPPILSPAAAATSAAPIIVALAAGSGHSLMLLDSGEVWGWGDNREGQVGVGFQAPYYTDAAFQRRNVVPELDETLPLRLDRPTRLRRWDVPGPDGSVGTGVADLRRVRSQIDYGDVASQLSGAAPYGGGRFVDVKAAGGVSLALTVNGVAWVWGSNALGGLGTCGCGACAFAGAAGGDCPFDPIQPAPPPPSPPLPSTLFDLSQDGLAANTSTPAAAPTAVAVASSTALGTSSSELAAGSSPVAAPSAAAQHASAYSGAVDRSQTCTCACPGTGNTCSTSQGVDSRGSVTYVNQGICVLLQAGSGALSFACDCESAGSLSGSISSQNSPMPLDLPGVFVNAISAGGAFFAISRSTCPEASNGQTCSGNGACISSNNSCSCNTGYVGVACGFTCGVGTAADLRAAITYLRMGYKNMYPGGAYNASTDSSIVGKVCSGNGVCNAVSGGCTCNPGWAGDHCQLPCYRDNEAKACSGHGTCVFNKLIDPLEPYCQCDHYFGAADCAAAGLPMMTGGVCAWHDSTLGFATCQASGLCGICSDSPAGRAAAPQAGALLALALALLLASL